ncbi:MAG TPA: hypothetical protein P5181_00175 [Dermatophilaceae bacterium]|nr:hypothetical protein [Dermatophilaceae bacterium]
MSIVPFFVVGGILALLFVAAVVAVVMLNRSDRQRLDQARALPAPVTQPHLGAQPVQQQPWQQPAQSWSTQPQPTWPQAAPQPGQPHPGPTAPQQPWQG